jgi:hypothetical protein
LLNSGSDEENELWGNRVMPFSQRRAQFHFWYAAYVGRCMCFVIKLVRRKMLHFLLFIPVSNPCAHGLNKEQVSCYTLTFPFFLLLYGGFGGLSSPDAFILYALISDNLAPLLVSLHCSAFFAMMSSPLWSTHFLGRKTMERIFK